MRKSILLIVLLNLFYIGNAQCWQSVSAGIYTTLGIKTDGTLWACGVNWNGQLGDGTTTDKNYFVQVGTDTRGERGEERGEGGREKSDYNIHCIPQHRSSINMTTVV